ncbi:MAG: hypothetical protein ACRD1K_18165 [Acidimicrobiales bacterium]
MTIVVLVVLAGIWAAVLVPPMLRSRAEARPADSIGNFRRQLRVLQRTGPTVAAMADTIPLGGLRRPGPAVAGPASLARPALSATAARRARTLRRRRDVLAVLLAGVTGTLALGAFGSLRALWWLHLVLDVAFVGYLVMLVRVRNDAAEREMKLRFLPATQPDNVILFRRSAN